MMPPVPWLLTPQLWPPYVLDFVPPSMDKTGTFPFYLHDTDAICRVYRGLTELFRPWWERLAAAEILLSDDPLALLCALENHNIPAGSWLVTGAPGITLRLIAECPAHACALAPLSLPHAGCAGLSLIHSWADAAAGVHTSQWHSTDALPQPPGVAGDSWTLAAALARISSLRPAAEKRVLASGWIISGVAQPDGTVGPVSMGNKGTLQSILRSPRAWLLPGLPASDAATSPPPLNPHLVWTVAAARHQIWRSGTVNRHTIRFPQSDDLHAIVGGLSWPVIVTSILAARPLRVHFWHSEESRADTTLLAAELPALMAGVGFTLAGPIALHLLNATDLATSEASMEFCLDLADAARPVLFNITSGNFLMKAAVTHLARSRPHWTLIYREAATDWHFNALFFPDGEPVQQLFNYQHLAALPLLWKSAHFTPKPCRLSVASVKDYFSPPNEQGTDFAEG